MQVSLEKIKVIDKMLDETDFGVKRRRGTLMALQKRIDDRSDRFQTLVPTRKQVQIYRNKNEGRKSYVEKKKLNLERDLFDFKRSLAILENKRLRLETKSKTLASGIKQFVLRLNKQKENILDILDISYAKQKRE